MSRLGAWVILPLVAFALASCGVVRVGKSSQQLRATNLGFELGSPGIGIPSAWTTGGTMNTTQFELAIDSDEKRSGKQAFRIRAIMPNPPGFGGVTQCVQTPKEPTALQYSGFLKTKDVSGSPQDSEETGAGLWIRVADPDTGDAISFDNLYIRWGPGGDEHIENRRLYGTSEWVKKDVKLKVPSNSGRTCFGVLLSGAGTLWADDLKLEYSSSD